jgi:hypothetical protein
MYRVKTVIRWHDPDGQIVGYLRETEMELPKWGKKKHLRSDINSVIHELQTSKNKQRRAAKSLSDFIIKAFDLNNIVQIKSTTQGSRIDLKGEEAVQYVKLLKEQPSCQ